MGGSTLRCVWAGANLDSSALKDAGIDCSTTWDGSEFRSPTIRTAKEWRNACVEEPTAQNLNSCSALIVLSSFISISDVKRGSKNRNSLQFRVLEIEFLNPKLDFTF